MRPPAPSVTYQGWIITPRTFQIRGSQRWTLDLVIVSRTRRRRAFSGAQTFRTEEAAIFGCHEYGRRIIDGLVPCCSLDDLG